MESSSDDDLDFQVSFRLRSSRLKKRPVRTVPEKVVRRSFGSRRVRSSDAVSWVIENATGRYSVRIRPKCAQMVPHGSCLSRRAMGFFPMAPSLCGGWTTQVIATSPHGGRAFRLLLERMRQTQTAAKERPENDPLPLQSVWG